MSQLLVNQKFPCAQISRKGSSCFDVTISTQKVDEVSSKSKSMVLIKRCSPSLQVNRRYNRGDYTGAARASLQAHSWGVSAVVFGVCIFFIVISLRVFFHSYHHYYYYY